MYKFEGPQEYTHPDQLIKSAGKTERYSNTGNSYLHQNALISLALLIAWV